MPTRRREKREMAERQKKRSLKKGEDPGYKPRQLTARSQNQKDYIRSIDTNPISFCTGPAGSGKTHCAIGMAVQMVRREQLERIIISRPLVGVGKDMGYLPGGVMEKVGPYIVPYFDEISYYLSSSMVGMWLNGTPAKLSVVPLSMMRGRTFNDTFVIVDEAQNATHPELKTLLTRMGENSRLIVCGDRDQSDLPDHQRGAMSDSIDRLRHIEGIEHVEMGSEDIVRSPMLAEIIKNLW